MTQRHEFEDVLDDMREVGFSVRPVDEAFERFTEKRAKYAPRLDAIGVMLAAPPGLWIGDRSFLGARSASRAHPKAEARRRRRENVYRDALIGLIGER